MTWALRVAHRSGAEAVLVKPAGLSSDDPHGRGESALAGAGEILGWPEARLPHRIDRLTRGYLVVARDAASAAFHSEAIRARRWLKAYVARLELPRRGTVDALVGEHRRYLRRKGPRAECVRSGGDPSHLEIVAAAPSPDGRACDVAIVLGSGRFHQIRATCADLGAAVLGDALYGSDAAVEPYLEHALLRFPSASGGDVRLFDAADPERPRVAPEVLDALTRLAR